MRAVRHASPGIRQEHDHEPEHGLPEALPEGERILWQGSPDWRHLARHAFHVRKLAVYFAALLVLRVVIQASSGVPAGQIAKSLLLLGPLALICLGIVVVLARLSAQSTVYTLTNRRMVLRIGIVLTLTFNLPLRRIASADLRADADGHGDIPLTLAQGERIAWLHLWPHCRPWKLAQPQPMLRSIPDAARVASLLGQAWSAAVGQQQVARPTVEPEPSQAATGGMTDPVMAGR